MFQIISDSPAHSTGTNVLWEKPTLELDFSTQLISLEWIQSLSPELKDATLYRLCKIVESKPTLSESFALNQVLYRMISGNTFTESASRVAQRTGCDRKTILKGLNQAVEQNILLENLRPGTSNEYSFKPVEEWKPEPVVHKKDTPKVIQFPSTDNNGTLVETEPVQNLDDPQTDPNNVVNKLINKQQQLDVSIPITDTPTIWRSLPDGNRYAQIPPIHDQAVGVEIQRQMEEEGLTAQKVIGRAIAFSKIPLLVLKALASVGSRLLDACWKTESERKARGREYSLPQTLLLHSEDKPNSEEIEVVVSLQLSKTLTAMSVILTTEQMRHCLAEYGEDAMLDAAVQLRKSGVLESLEDKGNYFLNYLQNTVKGVAVEVVTPKKPGMAVIKSIASDTAAKFPTEIMQMLKKAEIHLVPAKAEKLWAAHGEKFVEAIAYVDQKTKEGKVTNREGYFVK
ncbi:MAG: hypothetical protein PUP92_08805 [Rhizonema sp. PD38]|nr:hypothetical protein [Rhizonema sp. PD38]